MEHLTNAVRGRSATRGALAALPLALALTTACARRVEERAPALFESATAALRRGDIARAESDLRLGEQLTHAEPASEWAWRFRFLEGDVVLARRELDLAAKLADADGAIPMPDVPELRARRQYLLARIQYVQSHLPRAFEVASIALPDAPPNSELKLEIDGFLGQVGLQLGKWAESEARLDGVVSAASASGHHDVEGMALVTQGMGKFIRNRCDEALPFFERAVALKDVAGTPIQGKALYNSGMCYARLGQFDRAIDVQRRAVTVLEIRPTSGDYEQALGQLGITYLLQGQVQEGLDYVQRAFTVATQAHIATDASLWAGNLAKAYIDLQRWDDAERFNEEARQIGGAAGGVRAAYRLEYSAFIAAGRRQFDEAVRLYQQVLASRDAPPSVLWHAHDGLAHVAVAKKEPRVAAREFEAALDVIEKTRAGLLRDDYKLSYLTELIDFYRAYVSELVAQKNITRALEIADSSRGRVLAERQRAAAPPRASVAALRRLASAAGTVFLSYWLTPSSSLMWVVAGDDVRQFVLPPSDEIDTMVREYQAAIGNALVDPLASRNTAGDALYRTLIAPAARFLRPGARLVIVADGSLHSLNFETLPVDAARRHYFIEDAEIQIAPSLASLTLARAGNVALPSLLIIGNPTPRPPEFPALKFAQTEMDAVASRLASDRIVRYDADRATPGAYRDATPKQYSYVHFAAHATANRDSPLDSAVILSGSDTTYKLYARDVAALPLSADLVTVSACRSAGERAYAGEGLVGFAWAFLRAGARRVVAGLWDVDDQSTADLMEHLYAGVARGERPSAALRLAKLDLIGRGGGLGRPYAWGAFQLFTVIP